MQHAEPDQLALLALGESLDGDDAEVTAHLELCALCRHEVEVLRNTAELARETVEYRDDEELDAPPAVWQRISAELELGGPVADLGGPPATELVRTPDGPGYAGEHRRGGTGRGRGGSVADISAAPSRRRWLRATGALVAAVAIGVVGTLVAVRPFQDDPVPSVTASSTARLAPVAGGPGGVSGRAVVRPGAAGPELVVTAAGLPLQQGYYEVWVFDGNRNMVSVGVLGANSTAVLPLPPTLDLRTYHDVDVSQERYDGDQTHSLVSVLRGTLTG